MDSYSHGEFDISGIVVTITDPATEISTIMDAWARFESGWYCDSISDKSYPWLHTVYYNYQDPTDPEKKWYDMLIGYMTNTWAIQADNEVITLTIPAQDYQYVTITEWIPESIAPKWEEINTMDPAELPRAWGYDLDMYDETGTQVTIAVSVTK